MPLVVRAAVVVFAYGTAVHVFQLATGGYPGLPGWLAAYFVSLTALDALAVVLLLRRPVAGLYFGGFLLATDAMANFYANYVLDDSPGVTAGRVGQAVITVVAVALIALTRPTARVLRRR